MLCYTYIAWLVSSSWFLSGLAIAVCRLRCQDLPMQLRAMDDSHIMLRILIMPPSPHTRAFPSIGKSFSLLPFIFVIKWRSRCATEYLCFFFFVAPVKHSCMSELLSRCIMSKVNARVKNLKCQCSLFFASWQLDWFRQFVSLLSFVRVGNVLMRSDCCSCVANS